jgi:hypothetical protein
MNYEPSKVRVRCAPAEEEGVAWRMDGSQNARLTQGPDYLFEVVGRAETFAPMPMQLVASCVLALPPRAARVAPRHRSQCAAVSRRAAAVRHGAFGALRAER